MGLLRRFAPRNDKLFYNLPHLRCHCEPDEGGRCFVASLLAMTIDLSTYLICLVIASPTKEGVASSLRSSQ